MTRLGKRGAEDRLTRRGALLMLRASNSHDQARAQWVGQLTRRSSSGLADGRCGRSWRLPSRTTERSTHVDTEQMVYGIGQDAIYMHGWRLMDDVRVATVQTVVTVPYHHRKLALLARHSTASSSSSSSSSGTGAMAASPWQLGRSNRGVMSPDSVIPRSGSRTTTSDKSQGT